jgi:gp16 family phage-associated protein
MTTAQKSARERLLRHGLTVKEWAEKNGYPLHSVRAVLYGRNKGNYGQAHKIAVALGLKETGA